MDPKPKGWSARYASAFEAPSVVGRYHLRPPYPAETIDVLAELAGGGAVLEAGSGLGELSRALAGRVVRVDAVDASRPMIERGRLLPHGELVHWIHAAIEDAPLEGPYALVVAAQSVHWFDWERVMLIFAAALAPEGLLALVERDWLRDDRLRARLRPVYARHSVNPDFRQLDPVSELERRGLFIRAGTRTTGPEPWRPTIDELLGCQHSQSGFVLERQADPAAFDAEVRAVVGELVERRDDGRYELDVSAEIVWGRPAGPGR